MFVGEKKLVELVSTENKIAEARMLRECPICGSQNNKHVKTERCEFPEDAHPIVTAFHNMWIHLLECDDCGFAFTQELPSEPTFFHHRYDNHNFDPKHEVESNRKHAIFDEIFQLFKEEGKESGQYLDVGSFAGKLLKYASERGFEPRGVEVNPKLAHYTKEILNIDVFCGKIQEVDLPENEFDAVTIIDVLEHLEDPRLIVEKLGKSLKKDGVLMIKVPHYNMQFLKQDILNSLGISPTGIFQSFGHINHFNKRSMERTAELCGLNLVRCYNAKSEHWPKTSFFNKFRNFLRDAYWHFSNAVIKTTGIDLGLNTIYILKK